MPIKQSAINRLSELQYLINNLQEDIYKQQDELNKLNESLQTTHNKLIDISAIMTALKTTLINKKA